MGRLKICSKESSDCVVVKITCCPCREPKLDTNNHILLKTLFEKDEVMQAHHSADSANILRQALGTKHSPNTLNMAHQYGGRYREESPSTEKNTF